MEMPKKVKAEIVDDFGRENKKENRFFKDVNRYWFRFKLGTAILLDIIDLFIGWMPIVNSAWDIASFLILLLILKNKRLAFLSLIELPLIGLPPFSIIDMFLPICTVTVLIDSGNINSGKNSFSFYSGAI